ncbi:MAG: hypothetical protein NZM28_02465 [Fimbriimonadales bacterium]|nr:hypothetical protein [Fimbriimonadales bacterium]
MAEEIPKLVLDTTVLSNFLQIAQSDFLSQLPFQMLTVPPVMAEVRQGFDTGKVPIASLEWLAVLELSEMEQQTFERYNLILGAGEAAALAVCASRRLRLATDDYEARQLAVQLRIPLTGTIGLLAVGVRTGIIVSETAEQWLQQMIQRGYHSPVKSLAELGEL